MITVTETARIQSKPDTVEATISLHSREKNYQKCQEQLDGRSRELIDRIRGLGLNRLSIQSSDFRIHPDYDYDQKILGKGFNGIHELSIRFALEADSLGSFYRTLFASESRADLELSFRLANVEEAKTAAVNLAIQNARKRAEEAAATAGVQVGAIVSIRPQTAVGSSRKHSFGEDHLPMMREAALRSADGGDPDPTPGLEAGELEVVASVTMRFRLVQE